MWSEAETQSLKLIQYGANFGDETDALGIEQQAQRACQAKPQSFSHLSSQSIVEHYYGLTRLQGQHLRVGPVLPALSKAEGSLSKGHAALASAGPRRSNNSTNLPTSTVPRRIYVLLSRRVLLIAMLPDARQYLLEAFWVAGHLLHNAG